MGTSTLLITKFVILFFILISSGGISPVTSTAPQECSDEAIDSCVDRAKALSLKIIAIVTILITSMMGVSAPLFSRSVPFLHPDGNIFIIIKCFASGIILGTGFMHVLPDSFDMLSSKCLNDNPWHKFPFTGFVAMLSGVFTLMVDSIATSIYSRKNSIGVSPNGDVDQERATPVVIGGHNHGHGLHGHCHGVAPAAKDGGSGSQLLRYRVIAMVLELGIIVHSVVIGLSLGATNNACTIKGLIAALCFHQMFEGMGLGGCILQAEYSNMKKFLMAFFFAVTTPFGIALGIALSSIYKDNSPTALITVGLLNASSAGLLIYMALVDLLAAEFMGAKLQSSIKLQVKSSAAVLLGAGGMSVLAKWA